ncbi:unnamed protein product [Moneuplotes crassus]|uniref:EF-hand domain-containing protein n=1 Tax=Euplotes crassus TaxID=5936 RepID=A0AAD1Y4G1_EUPCR|nr:unnamed protein product [Moneuplotes crassus]
MEKYGKNCESIEVVRQVLAEQKDFSFVNIFRRLNKINKDGFITEQEISSYLEETGIRNSQEIVEFFVKSFDHDDDGRISFQDLLLSMIPQKSLKIYKESIKKDKGSFKVNSQEDPPKEVLYESYLDSNDDPTQEVLELWPRLSTVPNTEQKVYITNLATGLEFALKKYFEAYLGLYSSIFMARMYFAENIEDQNNSIDEPNAGINLTETLIKILACKGLEAYLTKSRRRRYLYDRQMLISIFRGLDKDMDGKISVLDFLKSLSKNYTEENLNIQIASRFLDNLPQSELTGKRITFDSIISKKIQKRKKSRNPKTSSRLARERLIQANLRASSADQRYRTPKKRAVRKFSVEHALTWKQLVDSGNEIALVYIDNPTNASSRRETPFKSDRKRHFKSAKVENKYHQRVLDPNIYKFKKRKMFWPLNYHHQSKGKLLKSFKQHLDAYMHTFSLRKNVLDKSTQEKPHDILTITPEIPESAQQDVLESRFSMVLAKIIEFEERLEIQKQELAKEESTELNDIRNSIFMNMGRDYFTVDDLVNALETLDFDPEICTLEIAQILLIKFSSIKDKRDFGTKITEKSLEYIMNSEELAIMFLPRDESFQELVLQRESKIADIKDKKHMDDSEKKQLKAIKMSIGGYLSWIIDGLITIKELIDEFIHFCNESESDLHNFINKTFDISILKSETYIPLHGLVDFLEKRKAKIINGTQAKDSNPYKAMSLIDSFLKLDSWDPQINSYYAKAVRFIDEILAYNNAIL